MKKRKNKRKTSHQQVIRLKPPNYIRKKARNLPIHSCLINNDWEDGGIATIWVTREKKNGLLVTGWYLIDLYCLGLKNTHYLYEIDFFELEEIHKNMSKENDVTFIKCDPNLAFNIVYGAIEYAEDLGFAPHKDFNTTEYLLDEVSTIDYIEIEFGSEGKPLFIAGPMDNPERIIKTLVRNVGEDNFDFIMPDHLDDFNDDDDFDEDIPDGHPFFSDEDIERKLSSLPDEHNQYVFFILLNIAAVIHDVINGDGYDEIDEVPLATYISNIVLAKTIDIDIQKTMDQKELEDLRSNIHHSTTVLLENYMAEKNLDYLLDEDFLPITRILSPEELDQLTDEEVDLYEKQLLYNMTLDEQATVSNLQIINLFIEKHTDFGEISHIDEQLSQKILQDIQKTIEIVEADHQLEATPDRLQKINETLQKLIEKYNLENHA